MVIDHATSPPPVAFVPKAPTPDVQPLPIEYQEHYKALKGPKQSKGEKKTTLHHKAPPQKKTTKPLEQKRRNNILHYRDTIMHQYATIMQENVLQEQKSHELN